MKESKLWDLNVESDQAPVYMPWLYIVIDSVDWANHMIC